ncbi:MAG: hypothetical protein V1921_01570 [Candidatus Altiarchaeota archaeon]
MMYGPNFLILLVIAIPGVMIWASIVDLTQKLSDYITKNKLKIKIHWGVFDFHFYKWLLMKNPHDDDMTLAYKKRIQRRWIIGMFLILMAFYKILEGGI